jgi:HAE1 family hydrophobic/amphiphilic exporter-1
VNISSPFIRRPVATALMSAALLLIGVVAYLQLPISSLPNVDFPTLQVSAALPGGSPETMASNVATPLERQFSLIPGLTQMTSTNALGTTNITLQFELGQSMTSEFQQVQAAINAASAQLPTNLPAQPTIRQVNPADAPVMVLSLTSDTLPIDQVDNYADVIFSQQISRLPGVGLVNIGGQQKPAVKISLDPRKVAARGLQFDNLRAAIVSQTTNQPKGSINGRLHNLTVYANDQLLDARPWNDLVVGYTDGRPIRISDLGSAEPGVENDQIGAWVFPGKANTDPTLKTQQAIQLIIYKTPGANVISTVDGIKQALPKLKANIPPGIDVHILSDRTQTIRAAVQDVKTTLIVTIVLVVAVIWLFLLNVRATIIPSTVIPIALLVAMAVMLMLHYTLDNLSLMALSIAVGFVVDDAIVMVEIIWKKLEEGASPFEAALAGAGEVSFTILTISISLVAVFTPLMFMSGIVGLLMREFAVTLSASVLVSMALTVTLTPMLCSLYLKRPAPPSNRFTRSLEQGFARLEKAYEGALGAVLKHKRITLGVFFASMALAGLFYATANTGFFPQQDTGFLSGVMLTSQDASFAKTREKAMLVGKVIAQDPDVAEFGMFVGSGGANQANILITLKPQDSGRKTSADGVINRLRPKLANIVGANTYLQALQDITVGARVGQAQYQYTLSDSDSNELDKWAPRLLAALQRMPLLSDVSTDQQTNGAAVNLNIDREAAARFGLSPTTVDAAVYELVGQAEVTQFFTQQNSYHVLLEAPKQQQATAEILNSVYLLSPLTGKSVPLSQFVRIDPNGHSTLTVNHQAEFPAVTLSFNLPPHVALSQATQAIQKARDALGAPATLNGSFQGTAQAFQQSLSSEPVLIGAALIAIYVILGMLYESFVHPLTILSTLPSAGLGALVALRLAGDDLNVIGIIGIILLIGIVKKNGILIVDVAIRLERELHLDAEEAARRASMERFRPILMTTACALLTGVPMIVLNGTGSEFRRPLGYSIVGGLLVSQVLTLFTTPVVYLYLDKVRTWLGGSKPASTTAQPRAAQ